MRQLTTVDGLDGARAAAEPVKWTVRRTAAFVAALSVTLWAGIVGLIVVAL
jgi:hypothetical protein